MTHDPTQLEVQALGDMRVDGEAIQEIYRRYSTGQYLVNRRYQRKLVWTTEQKERLIDSIANGLPIPLILLAERGMSSIPAKTFEIIDGLQRLHAITSFISNDFSYEGKYFDLETLASTKARKDDPSDSLEQRTPILDRDVCVRIVNYQVPISAYSAAKASSVDEVFRRINSSGRQLSRQEVRQAGITSGVAGVVRKLSALIREDATMNDVLPLEDIPSISIRGPQDNGPGIDIDKVFWVQNKILRRDDLRGSLDEQSVLDIILEMMDVKEPLSTQTRNEAYGDSSALGATVASALTKIGEYRLIEEFDQVMQVCLRLSSFIAEHELKNSLMEFMGRPPGNPAARYFHVFFMAVAGCHNKGLRLDSVAELADAVHGIWEKESINPGGTWTFEDRRTRITKFQRQIAEAFAEVDNVSSNYNDVDILIRDLKNYELENERFELKGGLLSLDQKRGKVAQALMDKILKICTAIANVGPQGEGRVYIGVTDSRGATQKHLDVYGIEQLAVTGGESLNFDIIGVDHEVAALDESLDIYFGRLVKSFRDSSKITDEVFRKALIEGIKLLRVVDRLGSCRHVIAIHVPAATEPVDFEGSYWVKYGSDTSELKGKQVILKHAEFEAAR